MHVYISGAGPVGLAAAIALAGRGYRVTMADRAAGITNEARAVGVNRNSLVLLSPSGAAAEIMARATLVRTARVMEDDRRLTELTIPGQKRRLPTLVALAQGETERVLLDIVQRHGIEVLWNFETTGLAETADGVTTTLTHRTTGETREIRADYGFGADGSHSAVRRLLGIAMSERMVDGTWSVADAHCETPWRNEACAVLSRVGAVGFFITIGGGRYRLISNRPDVLTLASRYMTVKDVLQEGTFTVGLRVAEVMGKGRVAIGGDAAHTHSPVGGRGMNLGIADAFAFAEAVEDRDLAAYRTARLGDAQKTVALTDRAYRMLSTTNPVGLIARNAALKTAGFVTGLIG